MKKLLIVATFSITVAAVIKRVADLTNSVENLENKTSILIGEITQIESVLTQKQ